MRTGPDLTPGVTRDQVLEVVIERIPAGDRLVHPGIAEHLAALDHALVTALLVVHSIPPRHCEERSDEAIQISLMAPDCVASPALTFASAESRSEERRVGIECRRAGCCVYRRDN